MSGVGATDAPYVYPLDADDLLMPGSLARLAAALEQAPQCAVAYGDFEIFGAFEGVFRSPPRFDPWALTYANFIPCGSLLRREAIESVGGWDFASGMEDWDLWLKLADAGWSGVKVPGPAYRKRVDGPRMQAHARRNQRRFHRELRRRHPQLFASRRSLARESQPPRHTRLLYPPLFGLRNLGLVPMRLEGALYRRMVGAAVRLG